MMDESETPSSFELFRAKLGRTFQVWLDWSTPHWIARWCAFTAMLACYLLRVFMIDGWYIITYGLGIYLLNNFIGFLSPQVDPDTEGPGLPMKESEEFRPFSRRLPEFKFWVASTRAVLYAFGMTFFEVFNVPVFWPILLLYFIALFFLTMKRQILHMWKHKYVPWSSGKTKYAGKEPSKDSK